MTRTLNSRRLRHDSRPSRRAYALESLESRVLLAATAPPVLQPPPGLTLLDPVAIPKFVNDITAINPFVDGFTYQPDNAAGNHYTVGAYQIVQDLGLGINPGTGQPYQTALFGYGPTAGTATYPGRTFEVQVNQPIAVTWVNGLPEQHLVNVDPTLLHLGMNDFTYDPLTNSFSGGIPAVPHLHGGHTDAVYDGTPMQWWNAAGDTGMHYVDTAIANPTQPANTFTYRNDQDAANLWYHDHAMGVTRLNAYAGMAGFYIIRDGYDTGAVDNPLKLPAGPYEMGLAIQDKQFLSNGQLWFPAGAQEWEGVPNVASTDPEMFGDVILVNGKAWPKMTVEARRYRFRLVNASDSRFYTISLAATKSNGQVGSTTALPIWQIGTDDGLLNAAVKQTKLTIAPGERVDFILDFTAIKPGTRIVMTNSARGPFPRGDTVITGTTDRVMAFDVVARTSPDLTAAPALLTNLRPASAIPAPAVVAPTRTMAMYETTDAWGRVTPLLGTPETSAEFMDPITENIQLGSTEVWQIFNNTADTHPLHLHQVAFQVLTRQTFTTRLQTLDISPSGVTHLGMSNTKLIGKPRLTTGADAGWKDTIQLNPGEVITVRATFDLPGLYVTHCHILSHEEHDMMRFMQVGPVAYPTPELVVDGTGAVVTPEPESEVMPMATASAVNAPVAGSPLLGSSTAVARVAPVVSTLSPGSPTKAAVVTARAPVSPALKLKVWLAKGARRAELPSNRAPASLPVPAWAKALLVSLRNWALELASGAPWIRR